ncbi:MULTISPECIES: inorganic phosphate transporter [unclassified Novosphingobium]|uniref:inorganic phosphate transporter n=1 Tax=unclassified Novosphingobium TaxID=2644732 RepID=UPI00104D6B38|nr:MULTISPECIES: inorganic phosphate transporter [unclassified Novosphingobium]MPS70473.1 inorganic phosphate transporter [Novosphingobium sp.]TCM34382.1 PiT family inorganic phosphate transporter [Novosphingobium sp. ST904]WRT96023.1 anion permease [Novosphingobium sp. RL4]
MNATLAPRPIDTAGTRPDLEKGLGAAGRIGFGAAIVAALVYVAFSVYSDAAAVGVEPTTYLPFILLFIALLIALGFEFVNGFHDTANAVATVIYTNAMPANVAVVWSGFFNFLGVLVSTGAVAFGIVSLLPVELILQVGSSAGFAMVFALLLAAILWNLATWWLGIPSSSSHTLIGSIIGVGVANALMHGKSGTAGVDWGKAAEIGQALLFSPLIGFGLAALLFAAMKVLVRKKELYEEPKDGLPPPWWIRALLIFTCTGVSFAHGSNDGQKGMGLIMLILIGTVPTAYALNRAVPERYTAEFHAGSLAAGAALDEASPPPGVPLDPAQARSRVTAYIADKTLAPATLPALSVLVHDVDRQVTDYGSLAKVPAAAVSNIRNDMYLASEAIKLLGKQKPAALSGQAQESLATYKASLDAGTRFIPTWVKVAVAIALGLGTMVGWKRIVVTVGEKIGKTHLTYAQGAAAELVAMGTIFGADHLGLPVSTTHVLSSGVAGTMAANRSGLQMSTVRNLLMAWVLTLPVSIVMAGGLYMLFSQVL